MCWLGGTPEALSVLGINGFDSLPPEDENGKTKKKLCLPRFPYLRLIGLGRVLAVAGWLVVFFSISWRRSNTRKREKQAESHPKI